MAKKQKYYAIAVGREPGIYTEWSLAEKQVKGFAGAKYKSFPSEEEARSWLKNPVQKKNTQKSKQRTAAPELPLSASDDTIIIYTDGGAINNPGPGGYGVVILQDGAEQELSGGFRMTTNNRMEMMACLVALKAVANLNKPIALYSDSSYLVNGVEKGWAKGWRSRGWRKKDGSPSLNSDLWEQLLDLLEGRDVTLRWVKGHAGNRYNERCDQLAVSSARGQELAVDTVYEAENL